jgi:hypothetical protein
MPPVSHDTIARFATLSGVSTVAMRRPRVADFLFAPFNDVDDRASRHAAACKAEREMRQASMSAWFGLRRG